MPAEAELPPGLVEHLKAQQEQMQAMHIEMQIREAELNLADRIRVLRWPMIFCSCRIPWTGWQPGQACIVHQAVMFHYKTGQWVGKP